MNSSEHFLVVTTNGTLLVSQFMGAGGEAPLRFSKHFVRVRLGLGLG